MNDLTIIARIGKNGLTFKVISPSTLKDNAPVVLFEGTEEQCKQFMTDNADKPVYSLIKIVDTDTWSSILK